MPTVHDWTLTVEFGYDYDDAPWQSGEEEAADFKARVLKDWAMDDEDLEPDEWVTEGATVRVTQDVLDYLTAPIRYATGYYIPKRIEIVRRDFP